ncbi:MAG: hypothetical protein Q7T89_12005, partial [Anaerolineales bacterium]|nr:hypothetical protein [Anaerolineales bacterium]
MEGVLRQIIPVICRRLPACPLKRVINTEPYQLKSAGRKPPFARTESFTKTLRPGVCQGAHFSHGGISMDIKNH